jgi:hypothetical protein
MDDAMRFLITTTLGLVLGFAPVLAQSNGTGQTVLVARQVGTSWKVDSDSGPTVGSLVILKSGERIILIDKRGIRHFRGPAVVELTAQNPREGLFNISYRALRSVSPERQNSQVRGSVSEREADFEEETSSTRLEPREKPLI